MDLRLGLATQRLTQMASELYGLREDYPPLTKRSDGKYEGGILAFVKGLRVSSLLTYCLREWLSDSGWDVSWGHIVNERGQSCSPECDIIIHKGHIRRWNGDGAGNPVMDFKFVDAANVIAVVSCKSQVTTVDANYPTQLSVYGVDRVLLFGECCTRSNYANLAGQAKTAGYLGLWCSYLTENGGSNWACDEKVYAEFYHTIRDLTKNAVA